MPHGLHVQSLMSFEKVNHFNIQKLKKKIPKDTNINKTTSIKLYKFAKRLRIIEQRLSNEYHPANQMRCPVHFCIGQEAIPAALNSSLKDKDYLFSHHRSHGYYLSKDAPLKRLVAELYGKTTGANGGMAGSQDISFSGNNFFSGAILAGAIGIAVGNALAQKLDKKKGITVVGFGESAADVGLFWESINYAFLKKLPILFICENNNYSVFSPQKKRQAGGEIFEKVRAFGSFSSKIFGNNICNLSSKIDKITNNIRKNNHPYFLEVLTYRFSPHYGPGSDLDIGYRTRKELEFWKNYCPIKLLEENLLKRKLINKNFINNYKKKVDKEINQSINYAKNSKFPNKLKVKYLNNIDENKVRKKIVIIKNSINKTISSKNKIIGY